MTADVFQELFLVGVKSELDTSEVQLASFAEDIVELDLGEKAMEGIPLLNGGRIKKFTPMTDGTFTLKCYPVGVAQDGNGAMQYYTGTALDSSDPYKVINSYSHKNCRIVILAAETLPTTASGTVGAGINADRITIINAVCTSVKPSYDDKIKSAEITWKWTPFMKSGSANFCEESTYTVGLSAVSATPTDPNGQW